MSLTIGCRIICADCGINTELNYCFETITTEEEEYERDFALCDSCINEREKDSNVQASDNDDALDSVGGCDSDDCN